LAGFSAPLRAFLCDGHLIPAYAPSIPHLVLSVRRHPITKRIESLPDPHHV
jgi:hypothetical protein